VDYWTCVHFASGLVIGLLLAGTGMALVAAMATAAVLLTLWELIEPDLHRLAGLRFTETITNQIVDVFSGLGGFLVGFTAANPSRMLVVLINILDFLAQ
jgi:hypothetical protein